MSQCKNIREKLGQYLDHRLNQEDSHLVEEHLSICVECRKELNQLLELQESSENTTSADTVANGEVKFNVQTGERKPRPHFLKNLIRKPVLSILTVLCIGVVALFAVFKFTNFYKDKPAYKTEEVDFAGEEYGALDFSSEGKSLPEVYPKEENSKIAGQVEYFDSTDELTAQGRENLLPLLGRTEPQLLAGYVYEQEPAAAEESKKDVPIPQVSFDKIIDIHLINTITLAEAQAKIEDTLNNAGVKVLGISDNIVRIELAYDRVGLLLQQLSTLNIGVISLSPGFSKPALQENLIFTLRLTESTQQ